MNQAVSRELREFHQFIAAMLGQNGNDISPEVVLDEWRELHPDNGETDNPAEGIQAVRLALADMEAGDTGRPAQEVVAELRRRLEARSE